MLVVGQANDRDVARGPACALARDRLEDDVEDRRSEARRVRLDAGDEAPWRESRLDDDGVGARPRLQPFAPRAEAREVAIDTTDFRE